MTDSNPKRTSLYETHKGLKARLVPFAGWLMPVSYTSVLAEHKAVRERCGIFDVSHMGELRIKGDDAAPFLQAITINNVDDLKVGHGQYSALLNEHGGMIDDIIVYRIGVADYLMCVNASNVAKDYRHVAEQATRWTKVVVEDESALWSQIAVQGPKSKEAILPLAGINQQRLRDLDYMQVLELPLFGKASFIGRTGYTGEWGYELYVPHEIAARVWTALLESQPKTGIEPVGLGARDTLRLEACYLLYGNDMDETVSPLEAGIGWAVRLDGADFLGRQALVKQQTSGLRRLIFAFKMAEDGIPRHDMTVVSRGEAVGRVTSGSVLPTVGGAGGMALLDPTRVKIGDEVEIDIRGQRKVARLVKRPLYKPKIRG